MKLPPRLSIQVAHSIFAACLAAFITGTLSTARAAGVVGTGTAASCTDAALDAAVADGGLVTFNCGGPATVYITTKIIADDTTVDGGGVITISGGNSVRVFSVSTGVTFSVQNLTIANGHIDGNGGGILNNGTLRVTNSTFSDNTGSGGGPVGGGIYSSGTLSVTNSTFSGNRASSDGANSSLGGGIFNNGTLTVIGSTFSGNSADGAGGGIYSSGTVTVTNSTFSGNEAGGVGGGIINKGGTATVANSTFSGNSGAYGGGIYNDDGPLTVTNSTFFSNVGATHCEFELCGGGGGIYDGGSGMLTVANSTFSGNRATFSGIPGVPAEGGAISGDGRVINTIFANSPSGGNCSVQSFITDGGHNISDDGSCGFTGAGCTDTSGSSFCNTDPLLDPAGLANDGGPTQTIALQPSSPAIDAGDSEVCANAPVNGRDQRGYVRPGIGHTQCSIGAYEADAIPPPPCVGDCDGNGVVAINELIMGVNITLAFQPVMVCPAFATAERIVDIAQLITGVTNALDGCPRAPCAGYLEPCGSDGDCCDNMGCRQAACGCCPL